jgi:hypothetical protein
MQQPPPLVVGRTDYEGTNYKGMNYEETENRREREAGARARDKAEHLMHLHPPPVVFLDAAGRAPPSSPRDGKKYTKNIFTALACFKKNFASSLVESQETTPRKFFNRFRMRVRMRAALKRFRLLHSRLRPRVPCLCAVLERSLDLLIGIVRWRSSVWR